MKIDRNLLTELTRLPDRELWQTIRQIADEKGIRLPEATPPHETLELLRATVKGNGGLKLGEAVTIINRYVKGEGR